MNKFLLAAFSVLSCCAISLAPPALAQVDAEALVQVQNVTKAEDFNVTDLNETLANHSVVVFVKSNCPYSQQVTDLLRNDGVDAYVINMDKVSDPQAVKKELNERTNNSIVPKIFIKGKYIGMLSQLKEYEATGKLYELTGS